MWTIKLVKVANANDDNKDESNGFTTTAIKGISDGGSINPYAIVDKALPSLIKESLICS